MGCLKLLNNSKLYAIAGGKQYQPLAVAYNREWLLDESMNDAHGNTTSMPHLSSMQWDFADRLRQATNGTFTSYYNYDSSGERSRKVVDKGNIREERYYIGGYEVFRKYVNNSLDTERTTLHVMDDTKTVALIETDTLQSTVTVRYQYDNHLGSACLELDQNAGIISYEEYHPFGTTSYRSGKTETEVSLKRYKYVGKERDEETGLYYYGARYYAAWLCRFVSVDPLQHEYPDLTPFQYASNRPIIAIDIDGLEAYYMPDGTKVGQVGKNTDVRLINEGVKLEDAKKYIDSANKALNTVDPESEEGKKALEVINLFSEKNSTRVGMTEDELNTRAFMSTLKQTESHGNGSLPYNAKHNVKGKLTTFTDKSYEEAKEDYANHPYAGKKGSSPAGAYQLLKGTFKYQLENNPDVIDFGPNSQDYAVIGVFSTKGIDAIESIKKGDLETAVKKLIKDKWGNVQFASLPGGGQEMKGMNMDMLKKMFKANLSNELKGITDVSILQGQLFKHRPKSK